MVTFETASLQTFEACESATAFGVDFKPGDSIEVLLGQNWNPEDGLGEGGPDGEMR